MDLAMDFAMDLAMDFHIHAQIHCGNGFGFGNGFDSALAYVVVSVPQGGVCARARAHLREEGCRARAGALFTHTTAAETAPLPESGHVSWL